MIPFGIVCIVVGAVLFVLSLPRNNAKIEVEAGSIKANLPEITGWARFFVFILGVIFISLGLAIGVTEFMRSVNTEDQLSQPSPPSIPTSIETNTSVPVISTDAPAQQLTQDITNTNVLSDTSSPIENSSTSQPTIEVSGSLTEAPSPTATVTNTPTSTSTPVVTATNTASPTSVSHQCIQSESYILLSTWTTPPVFLDSQSGDVKMFSHCPPESSVQYNSIAVDDQLIAVAKACGTSTTNISSYFEMFTVEGDLLPHYRSKLIDLSPDCRIDFTVQDTIGEKIGLMIKSSEPGIPPQQEPTPEASNLSLKECGENAFAKDSFATASPLFKRPDGYKSGWITSDPSQIVLPDGSVEKITIRYVLVVDDLSEVQLQNVSLGNIWGCWLRSDIADSVMDDAKHEFERMKQNAPNAVAGIFLVNTDGLQEIQRQ